MTREDTIRIAQQAGLHIATDVNWMPVIGLEYAEKFAELVASVERERILDICKEGLWDAEGIRYHLDNQERGTS